MARPPLPPEPAPEVDAIDDARAPRETRRMLGVDAPEKAFLDAWNADRLHHAWLLTGPPGVGKASFGYRVIRFLMTRPAPEDSGPSLFGDAPDARTDVQSLDVDEDNPIARHVDAGAHPGVVVLKRGWNEKTKKFRTSIGVDEVRELSDLFRLSAADGGWRAALIDAADDMNVNAANALLKLLEEPPKRALFLLVSHAPGRLPATIRSRCRRLQLRALSAEDSIAAIRLAAPDVSPELARRMTSLVGGAPGEALRLAEMGGDAAYGQALALLGDLPRINRSNLQSLMGEFSGREGAEKLRGFARLLRLAVERMARASVEGRDDPSLSAEERGLCARLAPNLRAARIWAAAALELGGRLDTAIGLNLDPQRTILDTALYLEETARQALR